jgi:two-component system, NtrC family, sensor kinase
MTSTEATRRVLIVDDNRAIHDDFRKILAAPAQDADLDALEAHLLGEATAQVAPTTSFELVSAYQGQEAHALVTAERAAGRRFALAFVDMRMPPGLDGLQTIEGLWAIDPDLQIVICSAFSDYSWSEIRARVGERDGLLIIKKPFDAIEVTQCAHALAAKWELARLARVHLDDLEARIRSRTAELQATNARLAIQMRELAQMESDLRLAQKLESVGRLAAGIAHEINTPVQYASDTATFLRDAFTDLIQVATGHAAVSRLVVDGHDAVAAARAAIDAEAEADLPFMLDAVPQAADQVLEGLGRVATIVRAMKVFAHPGQLDVAVTDLNRAVESTVTVARNEYRYVADLRLELGSVPPVNCRVGEINQAILNLVVNASHAISDVVEGTQRRGTIVVSTRADGDWACVSVSDDGCGIPETIRDKIFDPFFTTKEVGTGTGQGLALARSVIASHGGTLSFQSTVGHGTTFEIRIPIAGPAAVRVEAA